METLFSISIALAAGLFVSRLVKPLKLPAVTGYLIAGILIGPYCLGSLGLTGLFTSLEGVESMKIISEVALGFIAFAIGTEFEWKNLRTIGRQAVVIGIVQALMAMVFVDAALLCLHLLLGNKLPVPAAITLGAIATATAPAATIMVVKQYKAHGPLTSILLPVVALDDAVGLVAFSVSFGVARALQSGSADLISIIVEPLVEVICSLLLGTVVGFVFTWVESLFKSNSKRLCLSITFVLLAISLAKLEFEVGGVHVGFSSLLVCMMLGTVFCNICKSADELMEKTDKWTMPIYVIFFVLSGAELQLDVFADIAIVGVGVVYILFRSFGKYVGAFVSSRATKCSPSIQKYLGVTLLPQAGVSIGMSATALALGAVEGTLVRNIILFSVMIYELVGPLLTKIALTKAGDIHPKETENTRRLTVAEAFADDIDEDDSTK